MMKSTVKSFQPLSVKWSAWERESVWVCVCVCVVCRAVATASLEDWSILTFSSPLVEPTVPDFAWLPFFQPTVIHDCIFPPLDQVLHKLTSTPKINVVISAEGAEPLTYSRSVNFTFSLWTCFFFRSSSSSFSLCCRRYSSRFSCIQ